MFNEVLNLKGLFLEMWRLRLHPERHYRWHPCVSGHRPIAVVCAYCQRVNRNRIAVGEPKLNSGLKLSFGSRFLGDSQNPGGSFWVRLGFWTTQKPLESRFGSVLI